MNAQPQSQRPHLTPDQVKARADYLNGIAKIRADVSATLEQVDRDSERMARPFWKVFPFVGGAITAAAAATLVHFLM